MKNKRPIEGPVQRLFGPTARRENESFVGPAAAPLAPRSWENLLTAVEDAIGLIAKSEETGWCVYAVDARERLEGALREVKASGERAGICIPSSLIAALTDFVSSEVEKARGGANEKLTHEAGDQKL